jgi:hypothetical protein
VLADLQRDDAQEVSGFGLIGRLPQHLPVRLLRLRELARLVPLEAFGQPLGERGRRAAHQIPRSARNLA